MRSLFSPLLLLSLAIVFLTVHARSNSPSMLSHGVQKLVKSAPHPTMDPRNRYGAVFARETYYGAGEDSIGIGGDIWPTSIFWNFYDIGTPSRRYPAAIDSGSYTLDIEGSDCSGCTTTSPNIGYDPSKSSSSVDQNQPWSNTYETCVPTDPTQPCTVKGQLFEDVVSVAGSESVKVVFGRIDQQTPNFYQFAEIDGVCGYAGSQGETSVIGSLYTAGAIPKHAWSLCLNEDGLHSNGTLTLGGFDQRYALSSPAYTPNASPGEYYSMYVDGMRVNSQSLDGVERQVIIDTGTNDLLLNDEAYQSLHSILKSMCSSTHLVGVCGEPEGHTLFDGKCFNMASSDVEKFPDITFNLAKGLNLTMKGRDYILNGFGSIPFKMGKYCLGVGKTGYGGLFIVGDSLLHNYYVEFDLEQSRIGWAPVNKTACGSLPLHH